MPITNYARNEGYRISGRNKRRNHKCKFKRIKKSKPPLGLLRPGQLSDETYRGPAIGSCWDSEISLTAKPRYVVVQWQTRFLKGFVGNIRFVLLAKTRLRPIR